MGNTRLQVVTLVAALVVSNDTIVHNALYELNTVEHLVVSGYYCYYYYFVTSLNEAGNYWKSY